MRTLPLPPQRPGFLALGLFLALLGGAGNSLAQSAPAPEPSVNTIPLLSADGYDPRKEENREISNLTTGIGVTLFGSIYTSNLDIKKEITQKLAGPVMRKYFPDPAERAALANKIDASLRSRYLGGVLSNEVVNAATIYAADAMSSTLIDRAMQVEGVKDASRRALWVKHLQQPFHACMQQARSYSEGQKCLDAFETNSEANIGLALSFELARQELGTPYAKDRPAAYSKCVKPGEPGAESRVRGCVVENMRQAIGAYGEAKLLAAGKEKLPSATAALVVKGASPQFRSCLAAASDRAGFLACGNSFSLEGGGDIAAQAILMNPHLQATVPDSVTQQAIAAAGKATFETCAHALPVATSPESLGVCADQVKMEAAHRAVLVVLQHSVAHSSAAPADEQARMNDTTAAALSACWKNEASELKNSDCLKSVVMDLVNSIADYRLQRELPTNLLKQTPHLEADLLADARTCLSNKLSGNLLDAQDTDQKVDDCSSALLRSTAMKIAAFRLDQVVNGNTADPAVAPRLQAKLVQGEFSKCLGDLPDRDKATGCSLSLTRSAGKEVASTLFRQRFDDFVTKGGGLSAYHLTAAQKDEYFRGLLTTHGQCLDANVKGTLDHADTATDACFKTSVRSLALYLGGLEFERQLNSNVIDPVAPDELRTGFQKDFGGCLDEQKDPKFAIQDYVKHLDDCTFRLTKANTVKVAEVQLGARINQIIPGDTPAETRRRTNLQASLLDTFRLCLDTTNVSEEAKRDGCATNLRQDSTRILVEESVLSQAKLQLNAPDAPGEVYDLERVFEACTQKAGNAESCAVPFVIGSAKIVAHLKLTHTLADLMGESFEKNRGAEEGLEAEYAACLDQTKFAKVGDALQSQVDGCTEKIQAQAQSFTQDYLQKLMVGQSESEHARNLAASLAEVLPCLNNVMPAAPFNPNFMLFYDSEGTFDTMATLFGGYVNYDADKAGTDYEALIPDLVEDIKSAGPLEARRKLLDSMVKRGMVDQLLKSMVASAVKKSLDAMPDAEKLDPDTVAKILDKKTLDQALSPAVMEKLRPFLAEKILEPVIVDGKSLSKGAPAAALKDLRGRVADILLGSHEFGDTLVQSALQKQIDASAGGSFMKWLGVKTGKYRTLDWTEARKGAKGKAAEAYLKDQILKPQFDGEDLSPAEKANRAAQAKALVKAALQ